MSTAFPSDKAGEKPVHLDESLRHSAAAGAAALDPGRDPQEAATAQRAISMPRFGVALMDNEREMTTGWACASDGDPFYFTSITQLSNDTIWVTSCEWGEYQAKGRTLHNVRRLDYLRTSIQRIAADMGMRTDGHHGRFAVHALAQVVQNSVSACASLYGWTDPAAELKEDVLYEDIRRSIIQPPRSKPHVMPALAAAFQMSSSPQWPYAYEENTLSLTVRHNRMDYVQELLELPVPDEGWTSVVSSNELSLEYLLDPERPALVEATVELGRSDPDVAALVAFGSHAGRRGALRRWISQPELAWLVKHAHVQIQSAIRCRSARFLPQAAKLPAALTVDPVHALSLSAGLVAESHFCALASETYNRQTRRKQIGAWGVWLRAYDRARSFDLALAALKAGFMPLSYGSGAVTVRLQKHRLPELLDFACEHKIAHPSFYPYFVEHGLIEPGQAIGLAPGT
jgi:hypothetical protein